MIEMLVPRNQGMPPVYLVGNNKGVLIDIDHNKWQRKAEWDVPDRAAFAMETCSTRNEAIYLDKFQLKRAVLGSSAMQRVLDVQEFRYYADRHPEQINANDWSDQQIRELLMEADERNMDVVEYLLKKAKEKAKKAQEAEGVQEDGCSTQNATEANGTATTTKRTSTPKRDKRAKVQEGGFEYTDSNLQIILTPRQTEFMERLGELDGWKDKGVGGQYASSEYAECLEDTMNPMAVGAMISTLREKGIITTEYVKNDGTKRCMFRLTDLGISIYRSISNGRDA